MKRIVLVIAVTLPLVACGKEQAKKIEVRPVRVTSVRHTPSGEMISLTGQIQAKDQANLAFRIGGRLQERNVTVGDPVTPGQIVAKIDPKTIKTRCVQRKRIWLPRKPCWRMRNMLRVARASS
jgi:multidrug efflux pump subunit AcrA (membrane-fusion protein)